MNDIKRKVKSPLLRLLMEKCMQDANKNIQKQAYGKLEELWPEHEKKQVWFCDGVIEKF